MIENIKTKRQEEERIDSLNQEAIDLILEVIEDYFEELGFNKKDLKKLVRQKKRQKEKDRRSERTKAIKEKIKKQKERKEKQKETRKDRKLVGENTKNKKKKKV